MPAAYLSLIAILAASALAGQAVFALCGRREWSWLSPAIGLGLICALAWGTVRMPGEGSTALVALGVLTMVSAAILWSDWWCYLPAMRRGVPTLIGAVVLVSLPFIVEQRVGILGTSLNPDMSQHLFAAERLADGGVERLISQGYPLGPHSVVVAARRYRHQPRPGLRGLDAGDLGLRLPGARSSSSARFALPASSRSPCSSASPTWPRRT